MKRSLLVAALLLVVFSCDRTKDNLSPTTTTSTALAEAKAKFSPYGTDGLGEFVYKHLYNHALTEDPYNYLPEDKRTEFKARMDEVKTLTEDIPFNHEKLWQDAYQKGQVSASLRDEMMALSARMRIFFQVFTGRKSVESWFEEQKSILADKKGLTLSDKRFLIQHLVVVQYGVRSLIDSYAPLANYNENARESAVQASCSVQILNCTASNVSTYSGIGALFTLPGAIVGAIVGAYVSISTCQCSVEACRYPKYISTPDVCYNSNAGLDFYVAGLTSQTESILWEIYNSPNLAEANLIWRERTNANKYHVPGSRIAGYSTIYMVAIGSCEGGAYPTLTVQFNLNELGLPSIVVTGPTNVQVNPYSWVWYSATGRNLNNVTWGFSTFSGGNLGEVMQPYNNGAWVRWLTPGYVRLTATATTPCGSASNGPYVIVSN